jgi:hypothetical protein
VSRDDQHDGDVSFGEIPIRRAVDKSTLTVDWSIAERPKKPSGQFSSKSRPLLKEAASRGQQRGGNE